MREKGISQSCGIVGSYKVYLESETVTLLLLHSTTEVDEMLAIQVVYALTVMLLMH